MTNGQHEENKAVVLRLYAAYQAGDADALGVLLAEDFVNHNPRMTSGREASQAGLAQIGKTPTEGAGMDFFKLKEGKIIEHWDVLQDIPKQTASGQDMFSDSST